LRHGISVETHPITCVQELALARNQIGWLNSKLLRDLPDDVNRRTLPTLFDVDDRHAAKSKLGRKSRLANILALALLADPIANHLVEPIMLFRSHALR